MGNSRRHSTTTKRRIREAWPVCAYCSRDYKPYMSGQFTIDHVDPLSKGGGRGLANLVGCCRSCNESKGNRTPQQWAADILSFEERRQAPAAIAGELS